jgi:hypothetical protein
MTRISTETVTCPACDHEQEFTHWESVNVSLDPNLKDQLLRGELTTFTCNKCGAQVDVQAPLLYHDMEKQLMIWLLPGDMEPEMPQQNGLLGGLIERFSGQFTYRVVRDLNQLIEKIRIFDDELDDKVIELLKFMLCRGDPEAAEAPLFYDEQGESEEGQTTIRLAQVLDEEVRVVEMPWDDPPRDIVEALESDAGDAERQWLEVNGQFIAETLGEETPR